MSDTDLVPIVLRMSEQLGRIEGKGEATLAAIRKLDEGLKAVETRAEEAFDTATAAKAIATSTQGKVNKALSVLGLGVVGLGFDWLRKRLIGG